MVGSSSDNPVTLLLREPMKPSEAAVFSFLKKLLDGNSLSLLCQGFQKDELRETLGCCLICLLYEIQDILNIFFKIVLAEHSIIER